MRAARLVVLLQLLALACGGDDGAQGSPPTGGTGGKAGGSGGEAGASACSAQSCPEGCCDGEACRAPSWQACGLGGGVCARCLSGAACLGGVCANGIWGDAPLVVTVERIEAPGCAPGAGVRFRVGPVAGGCGQANPCTPSPPLVLPPLSRDDWPPEGLPFTVREAVTDGLCWAGVLPRPGLRKLGPLSVSASGGDGGLVVYSLHALDP